MGSLVVRELCFHKHGPFSFTIEGGECAGLTGPSGIGKTLMLRAITDLDPHRGQVFVNDIECNSVQAPEWRKMVGMLQAETQWWHDTVGEQLGDPPRELLHRLGFDEDVLEWEVRRLSTGEKQRLGLVRLLANSPQVLLLDEPTASLDMNNAGKVEEIIVEYRDKNHAAVLWVAHDFDQLKRLCSRYFVMETEKTMKEVIP